MKLKLEVPNDFSNLESMYCDVGTIVEKEEIEGKVMLTIQVDPSKVDELQRLLFRQRKGCSVYEQDCTFCNCE